MKKIVIIGANEFQNPLILKAKELGYETHVFAWQDGSIGEKTADYFYPISITKKDEILEKCKEISPKAVVTIASDLATLTVNYVAKNLGLPCNSEKCTLMATNKYKMRKAFKNAGIASPQFEILDESINLDCLKNMQYPLIVKPTDRSGSRAITKIYKKEELKKAIENAISNSFEKKAIVEEFIDGDEFSIEGITFKGNHTFLTTTKKQTTGDPNFIETGHLEPSGLDESIVKKVKSMISQALTALEVEYGATHSEFKVLPNGEIRIIEIGARMGGDCIGSHLVELSTGYDYIKMVIDVASGNPPDFSVLKSPKIAMIKFIFFKKDMEILNVIKERYPSLLYYVSEIKEFDFHEVIDSSTRYGYYIVCCDNIDEIRWLWND